MKILDDAFVFTNSGNSEIFAKWSVLALKNKYKAAYGKISDFLI